MSETLREYVISLMYDVNENSERRLDEGVGRTSRLIQNLGVGAAAAATAVAIAVESIAQRYSDLYYASQRTGESVQGLLSFEYAARQIGLTAGQARGAVEGFSMSLRMSPGLQGLARHLGASAAEPVEQIQQIIKRLKDSGMPYYAASRMLSMFGLDEHTSIQMWNNIERLTGATERYKNMLYSSGLNTEKISADSVRLSRTLSDLGIAFEVLGAKILHSLIGPLETAASGVTSTIERITSADKAATIAAQEKADPNLTATGEDSALARKYPGLAPYLKNWWQFSKRWFPPQTSIGPGEKLKRDEAVNFFTEKGWTREQALGLAANIKAESGFKTTDIGDAGQAYGLAQWHPDRQANFARWAGHDIRNSTAQEQLGFMHYELTEGSEKRAGQILKGTTSAFDAGAAVSKFYERPLRVEGEAQSRGATAQQWANEPPVTNNVNITINGKADPAEVTRATHDGLKKAHYSHFVRYGQSLR